jgi:hypothetical protein
MGASTSETQPFDNYLSLQHLLFSAVHLELDLPIRANIIQPHALGPDAMLRRVGLIFSGAELAASVLSSSFICASPVTYHRLLSRSAIGLGGVDL